MDFLELKNISERYIELVNPTSPDKILKVGEVAGMKANQRVIDFGCGFGEVLRMWAAAYGIGGIGIDIRPHACERAREKMAQAGLSERVEIVCGNAGQYEFAPQAFDVASCIGATFCWPGNWREAIGAMKRAIKPNGRLIVGEVYWNTALVPPALAAQQSSIRPERDLFEMARAEGCEVLYALHSNHDDWDHYEAENWRGLSDWLDEHPGHANYAEVLQHLRESQDEYAAYGREFFGWALYVLKLSH